MKDMTKSNKATNMEEMGIINRGKYIFFIIEALFTMLFDALVNPVENTFHRSRPEKQYIG